MTTYRPEEIAAIYRVMRERRDVRSGFRPDPLPDDTLLRLLEAAHRAPSVGLMQPWRFIVIRSVALRRAIHGIFEQARQQEQQTYSGERAQLYSQLALQGILTAPLNLCVVCDAESVRGHGLGRHTMPETALYSAVCAIQNLWLAARAEGIGVGWVSILDPECVRSLLKIPPSLTLVGYLCMGYVDDFAPEPELERAGWEGRLPLQEVLRRDSWEQPWIDAEDRS